MPQDKARDLLQQHQAALDQLMSQQFNDLDHLALQITSAFNNGNKLLIAGSGLLFPVGSIIANMFQHRLRLERPPLPALALGTDLNLTRSLERDHLENNLLARQFDIIGQNGDILLLLADGKHDPSLIQLAEQAHQRHCACHLIQPTSHQWNSPTPESVIQLQGETGGEIVSTTLFCGQLLCLLVEHALFGI